VADPVSATTYSDDLFSDKDLEQYRKAAGVAYDFAKQKYKDTGEQTRETIGKQATEERAGAKQKQEFSESDEARDTAQARGAYKY
jgi:cysteinyl-tRNA synthetase